MQSRTKKTFLNFITYIRWLGQIIELNFNHLNVEPGKGIKTPLE